MEGEWNRLNSIEEAINLLREYETNSTTKFSCTPVIKDSEKAVSSILERVKDV